ncbi:MAG TPA: hypothetical protein PLH57_05875 [Oligoflexia bacterium]|nr:hypothetical protein [Oligoflexia bacterium]
MSPNVNDILVLAAILLGLGIGGALFRTNLVVLFAALQTAAAGAVLAICAIGTASETARNTAQIFALIVTVSMSMSSVLGYIIFFSRFRAVKRSNINDAVELRE